MTTNKPKRKIRYRDRLRAHPGKGAATLFTLCGGLAGASNENAPILLGFVAGALFIGAIVWGIVLWTTRTQPVQEDEPDTNTCPGCGGPADNGHDRCIPPTPYYCSKCVTDWENYDG